MSVLLNTSTTEIYNTTTSNNNSNSSNNNNDNNNNNFNDSYSNSRLFVVSDPTRDKPSSELSSFVHNTSSASSSYPLHRSINLDNSNIITSMSTTVLTDTQRHIYQRLRAAALTKRKNPHQILDQEKLQDRYDCSKKMITVGQTHRIETL